MACLFDYVRSRGSQSFWMVSAACLLCSACATTWSSKPTVDPVLVAQAFDDPAELPSARTPSSAIPDFKPPTALRPCCLFGMDLKVKVGAAKLPGLKVENIRGPTELGPHGYDKGNLQREKNGLVYTCRGGFIDIAHVRDNADRTLYLSMQLARRLPDGVSMTLPDEGTRRLIVIRPLPPGVLARYGRWMVATTLAQWINFQLSVWHEIITWYGWESIKGFSEKVSAFSIEDLYSNVVGEKLAAGIVRSHESSSRSDYDRAMDAWIQEGLRRLGAVPRPQGRRAMQAVDGIYWDSRQTVADNKLVLRRYLRTASPLEGWLVVNAVPAGPVRAELQQMCEGEPGPLALSIPQRLGDHSLAELVTVEFQFSDWIPEGFPLPVHQGTVLTPADFARILRDIRARGQQELGVGFDEPGPLPETTRISSRAPRPRSGPDRARPPGY